MKNYEIVIFDVDGTVFDTTDGIIAALKATILNKGLKKLENKKLLDFIGPSIENAFSDMFGVEGTQLKDCILTFRQYYKDNLFKAKPYAGIEDVFKSLAGQKYKLAIATYKPQDTTELLLKYFKFTHYFDIICGSNNKEHLRKADIIKKCMEYTNISDNRNAVMIGDSYHDADGAKQVGIDFIGATYGFGFQTKEDINQISCSFFADTPRDLLQYF